MGELSAGEGSRWYACIIASCPELLRPKTASLETWYKK